MKPQCIQAVEAHLSAVSGKPVKLTAAAILRIDERMHEGAKVLARRDRAAWQSMSPDERTIAIGQWVREQEQAQADSQTRSKIRQLSAIVDAAKRLDAMAEARPDKPGKWSKSLIDVLEGVDNTLRGAEQVAVRGFGEMLKQARVGPWTMDFGNKRSDAFFADVVREIYGTDTGNAPAKSFAQKWSSTMDGYREARNRAGGTVGKLENYAPQSHDATVMQRVGKPAWVSFMMKNLDREQYISDAGARLTDPELENVIGKMYDSIVTDGVNKIQLDVQGLAEGAVGNFGSTNIARMLNTSHREIHLRDADAVIAYNNQFSDRALGASFFSHLNGAARDVALINEMGPNPGLTFATLKDTAAKRDSQMPGAVFDGDGSVKGGNRGAFSPDAYFRQIMHNNADFTDFDRISSALTAYQAATKLTSTGLRSVFQDTPGMLLNMADVGQLHNIGTVLHSAFRPKEAAQFGIGAEVAVRAAREGAERIMAQGRFNLANALSRYAQATMKYTLLDAWTNAARRAGQTSHALALGEWSRQPWDKLDSSQRGLLNNAGITEGDWQHIMSIPRKKLRGQDIHDVSDVSALGIPPDEAMRLQAQIMGFVRMGGDIVTSEHNLTAQTLMSAGGRTNALTKQVMLFKNAGAIQTAHMLDRLSRKSGETKVGYVAATAALSASFGYMALVAQAVTSGQNPPPPDDIRTIGKAMAVAGGFAMVQDLITSMYDAVSGDNSGHSSSAVPIFGDLATLGKIAFTAPTDPQKAGYMAIKFGRQQIAPLNYWYTKAAIDHMFFNDAAEALNPGYQRRLMKYADQKGQQYFWDPSGDLTAPEMGYYKKEFEFGN
ncbi:hypothetical protein [Klebsiella pneumoniae]|uniref:hypothetical protein n=1 Tax=Klebsiella pneumoniae TaxID=573 RepID=UPI0013E995A4|nr:hypothetical protein [Klebsiella pneumoniae]NGX72691.1 hypothetical protein [Klebsiella pneumoniae]HBW9712715.1 hypothetical protein [Klebsiella pneumoniae]HBY0123465.1 hypothetical protein [Klebsiella pneumoniae]